MRKQVVFCALAVLVLVTASTAALAARPAILVVKEGDPIGASTVSALNAPFTDSHGKVGFVGSMADGDRFIWWDDGPVFFASEETEYALTGGESTMGVSNTGGFIYSPSADGNDAVYTHEGLLLAKYNPIPGFPGLWSTFNSRPQMLPDGTAHWIGGTTETEGSGSSTNRALWRVTDPADPVFERVLGGGDIIEGKAIKTSASNFNYEFSDNGLHHAHILDMDTGSSSNDRHVYVDGAFVAQEGSPTGEGDNWAGLDIVSINNAGNHIFTGDTDGDTTADEFIAYNGTIAIRESATVDGVVLEGMAMRAASLNDLNHVAHAWGTSSAEYLFLGRAESLGDSLLVLAVGDEIDTDGDDVADWVVTDFNASTVIGPGIELAENGYVHLEVDLEPIGGGDEVEAILAMMFPWPSDVPGDMNCDWAVNFFDIDAFVLAVTDPVEYATQYPDCDIMNADTNGDGAVDFFDIDSFVALIIGG